MAPPAGCIEDTTRLNYSHKQSGHNSPWYSPKYFQILHRFKHEILPSYGWKTKTVLVVPTGNLLSTAAGGMLCLDFNLHRLPARGCSPGWGCLQSQGGGEWVWKGRAQVPWRRAPGERRGAWALIWPGATVTEGTGDRGGWRPAGEYDWLVTIVPLGAAVVLWPLSLPHKVRGHNGHHLEDRDRSDTDQEI